MQARRGGAASGRVGTLYRAWPNRRSSVAVLGAVASTAASLTGSHWVRDARRRSLRERRADLLVEHPELLQHVVVIVAVDPHDRVGDPAVDVGAQVVDV